MDGRVNVVSYMIEYSLIVLVPAVPGDTRSLSGLFSSKTVTPDTLPVAVRNQKFMYLRHYLT